MTITGRFLMEALSGAREPDAARISLEDGKAQSSKAGMGLAYDGEWVVADDIASGRLVEVLSGCPPSYPGCCLYQPGRRHMAASLRAFDDLATRLSFGVARKRLKPTDGVECRRPNLNPADCELAPPRLAADRYGRDDRRH